MNVLVLIYQDPEGYYPPTLYAIDALAAKSDKVILVYRKFFENTWKYPANVIKHVSSTHSPKNATNEGLFRKLMNFVHFYFLALRNIIRYKPAIIIAYDDIPLFALNLIPKVICRKSVLWYHNHDVTEGPRLRKYSVQWFAWKYQPSGLRKVQFFSLPSIDRLPYFPAKRPEHSYIPNFPNNRFKTLPVEENGADKIKLVYHGTIGRGHGFEEIIDILGEYHTHEITFDIIGNVPEDYKQELIALANTKGKAKCLFFRGRIPFSHLQETLASYHIGVPIHKTNTIQYSTGGTASNKIYEYAACGLPVLLYDNNHYRHYLDKYSWAFFTDLTSQNMLKQIEAIRTNYQSLSESARRSFLNENNFERYFEPVLSQAILNIPLK